MSSIQRSPSGKWWVRWRDAEGKQRTKTFERQVDAKNWKVKLDHDMASGAYIDPAAGEITFREFAEMWRTSQPHRPLTAENVERSLRVHVYPRFGDRAIGEILPSDLQAWVSGLEDSLAPSTIEVVVRHVVSVFRAAQRDRRIQYLPTDGLKRPKVIRDRVVPPTPAQVVAMADAITPRYRAVVMAMALAGLRPSEAFGLTEDAVDRDAATIHVDRQLITVDGDVRWGPPKSEVGDRHIPVPSELIAEFDRHRGEFGIGPDGAIFTNTRGDLIARHQFGAAWRSAAKKVGLDATPHGCRHSYASVLIAAGESVKVVQTRLGHASAQLTLDVYGHLWPEDDSATRAAIAGAYGELMCSPRVADAG